MGLSLTPLWVQLWNTRENYTLGPCHKRSALYSRGIHRNCCHPDCPYNWIFLGLYPGALLEISQVQPSSFATLAQSEQCCQMKICDKLVPVTQKHQSTKFQIKCVC